MPWIARWDRGIHGLNLGNDSGVGLSQDSNIVSRLPSPVTSPYIYVLAKSQRADGFYDYLYLSYDTVPLVGCEDKATRWAPFGQALPAACYFGTAGGDSIPASIDAHGFEGIFGCW